MNNLGTPIKSLHNFPHQVNTPITTQETIEVITPVMDEQTKKISFEKSLKKVNFQTTYHYVTPSVLSCAKGDHQYYLKDSKKYVASCKNCTKNRFISPLDMTIQDGHIIDRKTRSILD